MTRALPHLLVRLRAWAARRWLQARLRQVQMAETNATEAAQALADELALLRMERRTLQARLAYLQPPPAATRAPAAHRWSD